MKNGSWLPEEEDFKGLSDNFFDDLINHIDFPLEDIETTNDEGGDWDAGFEDLVPPPLDVLTNLFSSGNICKGQRVGIRKPVPISKQSSSSEVSSTIDNSPPDVKVSKLFQSSTLVSVLENSNGCALSRNQNRAQGLAFLVKGIRSKRKRATPLRIISLHSFCSEMCQLVALNESECETYLPFENPAKKKRKKNKAHSVSYSPKPFNSDGTSRKCTHCETTKTPQWREGPCGPKTLCNACGVRFRSGRLLPEYRPASSPTFIPTMHSNSHRKIIEMRRKGDEQFDTGMIHTVSSRA